MRTKIIFHDEIESELTQPVRLRSAAVIAETYVDRITVLAAKYNLDRAVFKALVEDAYGKADMPPAEKESVIALRKLKRLRVTAADLNWMFGYSIVRHR